MTSSNPACGFPAPVSPTGFGGKAELTVDYPPDETIGQDLFTFDLPDGGPSGSHRRGTRTTVSLDTRCYANPGRWDHESAVV